LNLHAYGAHSSAPLHLPAENGQPTRAIAIISDANEPLALAHLPRMLPSQQVYRLDREQSVPLSDINVLLAWGLGAYRFEKYLAPGKRVAALVADFSNASVQAALALVDASTRVRDMVNTPTEDMGPAHIETIVREIAQTYSAECKVLRGEELIANNFPAIHAVGRASHREPRLIELNWGDASHPKLSLVGKGVCFDTGGLDIKPADGMRNMKKDMGGAAHAIALAEWVMRSELKVHLQLLVPAVENAIGPNAYRPGEVIATRKGLSVEVDNTDAEGRIILCDALTYACESTPEWLIDFATLTGAARIALGPDLPALFSNRREMSQSIVAAGERSNDLYWPMPLHRPYLSYLKSNIADLANSGASRMAGCITAALYLERFVSDAQAWTHIDVYSWNDSDRPGKPQGGEAQGLRAMCAALKEKFG
jgi:leucyl aminopeptidase